MILSQNKIMSNKNQLIMCFNLLNIISYFHKYPKFLFLKTQNRVDYNDDLSNFNLSLYPPLDLKEKRIEPLKNYVINISDFELNSKNNFNSGGSFSLTRPIIDLNLNNTIFFNSSSQANGGGIYIDIPVNLNLKNCTFDNINATSNGGSIYTTNSDTIKMENISITNSKSGGHGGSAYINSNQNLNFSNIQIINSTSNNYGGSFYGISANNISISNSTILESESYSNGGSFYFQTSNNCSLMDLTIKNSSSNSNGGTLYLESPKLFITNIIIENSYSLYDGGSLLLYSSLNDIYEIFNSFFGFCRSSRNGGAIYYSVSKTYSSILLNECSFFSCQATSSGGSIYIKNSYSQNQMKLTMIKICCLSSFTNSLGDGAVIFDFSSSTNPGCKVNIHYLSVAFSGTNSTGSSLLYFQFGEQYFHGLNCSYNSLKQRSIGFFSPYYSSTYQYNNFIQCNSTSNEVLNMFSQISNQMDLEYSNIIQNNGSSCVYFYVTTAYKFSIKFSIFYENKASNYLIQCQSHAGIITGSYIFHIGSWQNGMSEENCIFASKITSTHILSHYSTYLCPTPNELGNLNIGCSQNCQTIPPIPTLCNYESNNEQYHIFSLSTMIHLIYLTMINILF